MGNSSWDNAAYTRKASTYASQSREEIFTSSNVLPAFDPKKITIRESVDSDANPNSTPIIVALDVTGSMGMIAEHIARTGLGSLVKGILDRKPVSDPHTMLMAVGDVHCDRAPLQVTQFEADSCLLEQLTSLWLESGGGGNGFESYDLPWAFAARKTVTDSFNKRAKKGYLFTVGDEPPPRYATTQNQLKASLGTPGEENISTKDLLVEAEEKWNVFHVIVEEGSHASRDLKGVSETWGALLDKRAIHMNNYKCLPEIIISVIEVNEGASPNEVIDSWEKKEIKDAVRYALFGNG